MSTSPNDPHTEPLDDPRGPLAAKVRLGLRAVRVALSDHPVFLPIVLRMTPRGTSRRLTEHTDLVIEGFPRSSNTFAAAAMHVAAPDVVVASHVHTPSQVVLAVRRRVPTLVVVREPRATIRSLIMAAPHVPVGMALWEWNHHHAVVWRHREGIVVGTFDQVTHAFGGVVDRVNHRFGTSFPLFEHTPENIEAVSAKMRADHDRYHPGDHRSAPWPIAGRAAASSGLDTEFDDPHHAEAWATADEWWQRYRSLAGE